MRAAGRLEVAGGGAQARTILVPHPPASFRTSLTDPGRPEWACVEERCVRPPARSQLGAS